MWRGPHVITKFRLPRNSALEAQNLMAVPHRDPTAFSTTHIAGKRSSRLIEYEDWQKPYLTPSRPTSIRDISIEYGCIRSNILNTVLGFFDSTETPHTMKLTASFQKSQASLNKSQASSTAARV